jgi:hypothetical protein
LIAIDGDEIDPPADQLGSQRWQAAELTVRPLDGLAFDEAGLTRSISC